MHPFAIRRRGALDEGQLIWTRKGFAPDEKQLSALGFVEDFGMILVAPVGLNELCNEVKAAVIGCLSIPIAAWGPFNLQLQIALIDQTMQLRAA